MYKEKPFILNLRTKGFTSWYHLISPTRKDRGTRMAVTGPPLRFTELKRLFNRRTHGRPSPWQFRGVFQPLNPFSVGFPWLLLPFIVSTKDLFPYDTRFRLCLSRAIALFHLLQTPVGNIGSPPGRAEGFDPLLDFGGNGLPGLRIILPRSEEHTSELQSRENIVCRLL